jgi:hypothetical protein
MKKAQALPRHEIFCRRHRRNLQVVQGCAKRKLDLIVRAFRAVHDDLVRDDRSLALQPERLLRRKIPLIAKTLAAVAGAEFPKRGIPRRAVPFARSEARRNQPAFHYILKKSVFVGPEYTAAALLKHLQHIEGFS